MAEPKGRSCCRKFKNYRQGCCVSQCTHLCTNPHLCRPGRRCDAPLLPGQLLLGLLLLLGHLQHELLLLGHLQRELLLLVDHLLLVLLLLQQHILHELLLLLLHILQELLLGHVVGLARLGRLLASLHRPQHV